MMKLLMSWDIQPGKESEYFDFAVKTLVPGMMKLGVRPTEAWYTIYGDAPQILAGWVAEDREALVQALNTREWHDLRQQLLRYVLNFSYKIVPATGYFQL